MDYSGLDLKKLADLLKPPEVPEVLNPSTATSSSAINANDPRRKVEVCQQKKNNPKTIEEYEEQESNELCEISHDSRLHPAYNIKYRQAVGTEDVFLQIGAKTPGTASCEDIVITIILPGEQFSNMELTVSKSDVKLMGFFHRLELPLPHPINPDLSKAHWNKDNETLVLTLRMVREFDYINF